MAKNCKRVAAVRRGRAHEGGNCSLAPGSRFTTSQFLRSGAQILLCASFHKPACVASFGYTRTTSPIHVQSQLETWSHNRAACHRHKEAPYPLKQACPYSTTKGLFSMSEQMLDEFSFLIKDKKVQPKEKLISPDEIKTINALVEQRSEARASGDYSSADLIRVKIDSISNASVGGNISVGGTADEFTISLPPGYKIEVKDIPRNQGGGSDWSLQPIYKVSNDLADAANLEDKAEGKHTNTDVSVLGLAHAALGLASASSEMGVSIDHSKLNDIVLQAKHRLLRTGEQELRGRKAADAVFWFALAGVTDDRSIGVDELKALNFSLFDALTFICLKELQRFGQKSSCRPTDIMHMVERIAAAGVQSDIFVALQKEAAMCLELKERQDINELVQRGVVETLYKGGFELHSERSLLWIWRFSTKQRKQRAFLQSAAKHYLGLASKSDQNSANERVDMEGNHYLLEGCTKSSVYWKTIFKDPTLPLVVDIGCGMGVSILGLSTSTGISCNDNEIDNPILDIDWNRCNFLGADLSQIGINFACSITKRWNLGDNVHFTVAPAEDIIECVANTYPGKVKLCMIQFPTPFRFNDDVLKSHEEQSGSGEEMKIKSVTNKGNLQLPTDAFSGFMVTNKLIQSAGSALDSKEGLLLLQSNCEDVAVFMNRLANDAGFVSIPSRNSVAKIIDSKDGIPQRTQKWIDLGGERAEGPIWNRETVLPSVRGATETEVACLLNGTPVHRVLLKPS